MTSKLYVASYEVLASERHAFLIYDEDGSDTDFTTNSSQVRILRGDWGSPNGDYVVWDSGDYDAGNLAIA